MQNKVYEVRKTVLPTGDFSVKKIKARTPREAIEMIDENGGGGLAYSYVQTPTGEVYCTATGRNIFYGAECLIRTVPLTIKT